MFDLGVARPETELNNDASCCADPGPSAAALPTLAVQILKGAKPSEIPIFLPTKFEILIKLKTAKARGPPQLLAIDDEMIE
jgi:hypothetical protein